VVGPLDRVGPTGRTARDRQLERVARRWGGGVQLLREVPGASTRRMPLPADYEFDVFFSYKRHSLTLDWTRGVHRRLQFW
jgi:hypothetical protein